MQAFIPHLPLSLPTPSRHSASSRRPQPACCAAPSSKSGPLSPAAATPVEDAGRKSAGAAGDDSWRIYEQAGNPCVVCLGTGKCKCLYCFGDGVVFIGPSRERDEETCPQCAGRKLEECPRCRGSGVRPSTRIDIATMKQVRNFTNEEISNGVTEPVAQASEPAAQVTEPVPEVVDAA